MNEYFQVRNLQNESLNKALELLRNPAEYDKLLTEGR